MGDIHRGVLRDRSHLADDGVVVVTVGVRLSTSEVILGPEIDSHGFIIGADAVLAKAAESVRSEVESIDPEQKPDMAQLQQVVRQSTLKVIRAETSRKPVVIPVVMEV